MQDNTKAVEAIMKMRERMAKPEKRIVNNLCDLNKEQHEDIEERKFRLNNPIEKDELE